MFRSFALKAAAGAVFLSLTSCGNPVDTEVQVSFDEFISGSIDADCDWSVRCGLFTNHATCVEGERGYTYWAQVRDDVARGVIAYHADNADKCLEHLRSDDCRSDYDSRPEYWDACDGVLVGTLAPGEGCFAWGQCTGHDVCELSACDPDVECCQSVCSSLGAIGAPCSGYFFSSDCDVGGYCTAAVEDFGTCQPRKSLGATCSLYPLDQCVDAAFCAVPSTELEGICTATPDTGETCDPALGACANYGDYCDAATAACMPFLPIGGPCDSEESCSYYDASCIEGTCKERGTTGDVCPDGGSDCVYSFDCVNGVCSAEPGETCP